MLGMAMNEEIARRLCLLTKRFYEEHASSFASTRRSGWAGWNRCLDEMAKASSSHGAPWPPDSLSVLDLACGNMRFESYLAHELPETSLDALAVDDCDALAACANENTAHVRFRRLDIARALAGGTDLYDALGAPACDLSVSFGFMHHLPLPQWRVETLRALVRCTVPGGFVCVSFWQFLNSVELAEKAREVDAIARKEAGIPELSEGDFLLGWKNLPGRYRYCHHFTPAQIDELAASVEDIAVTTARFDADGRTGDLNGYLVLRAR